MSWRCVSEDLSLQLGCSHIFPFALPTRVYFPIYPLLLCGFMNTSSAQSAFSLPLKLLEQLDYKPDGRSQRFGED